MFPNKIKGILLCRNTKSSSQSMTRSMQNNQCKCGESKEKAIGQKELHSFDNHVNFLNHILSKQFQIDLALIDQLVVGMIAYNNTEISQLYIHNDYQGIGIGQTLLDKAKTQSNGRLTLYTFEVNKRAQRFYEKMDLKSLAKGMKMKRIYLIYYTNGIPNNSLSFRK